MPAPLIGLTGYARSGKDTFAARLVERHGFTRASFADPVRLAAIRLDPIVALPPAPSYSSRRMIYCRLSEVIRTYGWERAKDEFPEVRRTLQRLGTDAIRTIDPDFWVRMAVGKLDPDVPTVFTDVRFPNEADAIRAAGGQIVRMVRRDDVLDPARHESETAMDNYVPDSHAYNVGTVEDLEHLADKCAAHWL